MHSLTEMQMIMLISHSGDKFETIKIMEDKRIFKAKVNFFLCRAHCSVKHVTAFGDLHCYLTKIKPFLQYHISFTISWVTIQEKKGKELPTILVLFSK